MKKTKKLLACLIAAATMFTMGSTAFAAEAGSKAQTPVDGKVQFTKEYKLIGEGESPAETFKIIEPVAPLVLLICLPVSVS